MPTTLVPTVHERIARCNTSVFLDRLVPGADVRLSIDGAELSATATGGQMLFPVPALNGGELIRARQDAGSGFTPWSPEVEVENAFVPPMVSPHTPAEVGSCSQCVWVTGMVPGCEVEVFLVSTGDVVGQGTADRHGETCVGILLEDTRGEVFNALGARMIVCGQPSPEAVSPITADGPLPRPVITGPLFGCQKMIPTSHLNPGARVRYEMDSEDLGSFCSCWEAVNVWIGTEMVAGLSVRAIPYWDGEPCKQEGPPSAWEPVVPPDDRIKPVIEEDVIEGDQTIRVTNQFAGATLLVRIKPDVASSFEEFGPVATSQEPEIDLNAPLVAGNVITVVQTLCNVSVESDPVIVLPKPAVILPPVIVPPLYECASGVQVSNLHPGAFVRLFADGIPIGTAWAGGANSIAVPTNLGADWKITARQRVGGTWSQHSDSAVPVDHPGPLEAPRIMQPVAQGDRSVRVSHVTPGAHVAIWYGTEKIGGTDATEPVVEVSVSPVPGVVFATVSLCGQEKTGARVEVIESPCSAGSFDKMADTFKKYPDFQVPQVEGDGGFVSPIEGQLYYPSSNGKNWAKGARNLPLVIMAHGWWQPQIESYLGYDYLASHLARWGMVVYSINLDEANMKGVSLSDPPQQYARGEIILHVIDQLGADPDLQGRIDFGRVGLIGHSMGGEGVTVAQHLNHSEGRGYGIRGVVSIAPTNHEPGVSLRGTKYLQLLGSMDTLSHAALSQPRFNGFRLYDRAWYPKTHAWIYGARHNPFNRKWLANGDYLESGYADLALSPAEHEAIARCLINAFFQDALYNRSEYAGYLEGTILPQSLRHLAIHLQHRRDPRRVVDNFGDQDAQEGFSAEAIDKSTNRIGLPVGAGGTGLVGWKDVELPASGAKTPHQGIALDIAWNPPAIPDAIYTSTTGSLVANEEDVIAIRLGQFLEDGSVNPAGQDADLFVTLDDGAHRATVRAGAVALVPFPDLQPSAAQMCPMRTIRIPLDAFMIANPNFDRFSIARVHLELKARPTGRLFADDIEISS